MFKKHTEESKQKLREIAILRGYGKNNKGRKRPDLSKRNKENPMKKENHPNWKGGITMNTVEYTKKWRVSKQEEKAKRLKPNICELCGDGGTICFDHDHNTGEFRGWICSRCNVVLGMCKDNTELLIKMVGYLNQEEATKLLK